MQAGMCEVGAIAGCSCAADYDSKCDRQWFRAQMRQLTAAVSRRPVAAVPPCLLPSTSESQLDKSGVDRTFADNLSEVWHAPSATHTAAM